MSKPVQLLRTLHSHIQNLLISFHWTSQISIPLSPQKAI